MVHSFNVLYKENIHAYIFFLLKKDVRKDQNMAFLSYIIIYINWHYLLWLSRMAVWKNRSSRVAALLAETNICNFIRSFITFFQTTSTFVEKSCYNKFSVDEMAANKVMCCLYILRQSRKNPFKYITFFKEIIFVSISISFTG